MNTDFNSNYTHASQHLGSLANATLSQPHMKNTFFSLYLTRENIDKYFYATCIWNRKRRLLSLRLTYYFSHQYFIKLLYQEQLEKGKTRFAIHTYAKEK